MEIKLNTEGIIVKAKDKGFIKKRVFIETEGKKVLFAM